MLVEEAKPSEQAPAEEVAPAEEEGKATAVAEGEGEGGAVLVEEAKPPEQAPVEEVAPAEKEGEKEATLGKTKSEAERLLEEGEKAIEEYNIERAEDRYKRAMEFVQEKRIPSNDPAIVTLKDQLAQLKEKIDDLKGRKERGRDLLDKARAEGKPEEAIRLLRSAEETFPKLVGLDNEKSTRRGQLERHLRQEVKQAISHAEYLAQDREYDEALEVLREMEERLNLLWDVLEYIGLDEKADEFKEEVESQKAKLQEEWNAWKRFGEIKEQIFREASRSGVPVDIIGLKERFAEIRGYLEGEFRNEWEELQRDIEIVVPRSECEGATIENPDLWTDGVELCLKGEDGWALYRLEKILGAGRTSVVWLAKQLYPRTKEAFREVALKVLRDPVWEPQFEDEIWVMNSLRQEEEEAKDGLSSIPKIYDKSPTGQSPRYIAMEFVKSPSVEDLLSPHMDLIRSMQEAAEQFVSLAGQWRELISAFNVAGEEFRGIIDEEFRRLVPEPQSALKLKEKVSELWEKHGRGLEEKDVAEIGFQAARILQMLHKLGRYYLDFQLKNLRWDRERGQLKILDWNVVSSWDSVDLERKIGMDKVASDIEHLAAYLFRMLTLNEPPSGGGSKVALSNAGGWVWREQVSDAMKAVLTKALSPEQEKRYIVAYDKNDPDICKASGGKIVSLADMRSLGGALKNIAFWWRADEELVMSCLRSLLNSTDSASTELAWMLYDIATKRGFDTKSLGNTLSAVAGRMRGDSLAMALAYLRSGSIREAEQVLENIPESLGAKRWLTIARDLESISILDKSFEILWSEDLLPEIVKAVEEENWLKASDLLSGLREAIGREDFLHCISEEIQIGRDLLDAEVRISALLELTAYEDVVNRNELETVSREIDQVRQKISESKSKCGYLAYSNKRLELLSERLKVLTANERRAKGILEPVPEDVNEIRRRISALFQSSASEELS